MLNSSSEDDDDDDDEDVLVEVLLDDEEDDDSGESETGAIRELAATSVLDEVSSEMNVFDGSLLLLDTNSLRSSLATASSSSGLRSV